LKKKPKMKVNEVERRRRGYEDDEAERTKKKIR
jgi:hypothetical protein